MSYFKEIVFLVLDQLKLSSDDSYYTEEHILYLLDKYRAFILKQKYSDLKRQIPETNYQTICLNLMQVPAIEGLNCGNKTYLRSIKTIPYLIPIGNPRVYPNDFYQGEIAYVSRDRMVNVGYNKYLNNIIYCSIAPDEYLYFKSENVQYLYLESVKFTGIFENTQQAYDLACDSTVICDIMEREYPLEDALIPLVIDMVVKTLINSESNPVDNTNDGKDDIESNVVSNGNQPNANQRRSSN